ncbi:unnamed protein product, partial [Ectocarpus sp. 12 AP-2014]
MEDSPTSESRGRRKIMEEDDDSTSSEKGVPSAGAASSATGGGGALGGTGLSSDSEDEEIPVLPRPPAEADVMVSRLPNILGVKTEAFDPDTYEEEAEADEFKFTTNIIRWRHKRGNLGRPELGDDGRALTESNTRLVKQERARAEEAMHKQARRKNKDYRKYSN